VNTKNIYLNRDGGSMALFFFSKKEELQSATTSK
jgi:hypothetical protein